MKIALLLNTDKPNCFTVAFEVCNHLKKLGAEILLDQSVRNQFLAPDTHYMDFDSMIQDCQILVALGGDGTILHAAKRAAIFHKPVLGVNVGRLGFMAGLESNELDRLSCLFSGDYMVDHRMLLQVTIENQPGIYYALNDAVVSKSSLSRIIDIDLALDGKDIASYRADGMIVSTPTGSTAYSLSAGGPVVDPEMSGILVTPICPHSLFARSILFRDDKKIRLTASCLSGTDAYLTVDGEQGRLLSPGDCVHIQKAELEASILRIKRQAFYDVLNEKLINRRS
ncbi:NAD(+)/NADH kinase [Solibaculum mannosilyticum]|uniref:NAD kinase n=1 Tax=Solibaculum mannosilyticum TaxID=2780922 RepID=A0A7I8D4U2_9FIRM|nr:NAD(+)/NADH kinase [Solibaculum mannosilyticum]BCI60499.1 NAD kinase [Solibaculum mannosilyticum]